MTLRLYNTLTRQKEDFVPLDPANVRMYVCGPTVYDYAHIGNARPVIVFDVLFRLLRHLYGADHVTYVRNITDVDDKINARAREEGVPIRDLTERTARQFHADIAALGVLPPTVEPRATEHIAEMIAIIEKLIARGHAYVADGHVLFDVPSMKDYGQLSRRPLDEMVAGARVDVAPYKKGDMDFVLWKPSDKDTPGWDSPWGRGRPGWHIECSAMSWKYLSDVFDIHGGGIDLVFPHHENELAQNLCAFGHRIMANVWMHNGFLQVEGQKMSKSLGNFVTIRELLANQPGEVLRLQMLTTHYSQPIDWTRTMTNLVQNELEDWVHKIDHIFGPNIGLSNAEVPVSTELVEFLCDDLNTSEALAFLRHQSRDVAHNADSAMSFLCNCEFIGLLNRRKLGLLSREYGGSATPELMVKSFDVYQDYRAKIHNGLPGAIEEFTAKIGGLGGVVRFHPNGAFELAQEQIEPSEIMTLIAARLEARKAKDWAESDRIRDELAAMGIAIKDNKDGTTSWEVKR